MDIEQIADAIQELELKLAWTQQEYQRYQYLNDEFERLMFNSMMEQKEAS